MKIILCFLRSKTLTQRTAFFAIKKVVLLYIAIKICACYAQFMKTALITGASSGIGLEFAKIFAENKYNLVLIARNLEKLQQVKSDLESEHGVQILLLAKNLSLKNSPREIFAELQSKNIEIEVLINNAGFGEYGKFAEIDLQKQLDMLDLNISALTALTHLFLPAMLLRKNGKILNVASTAAFQPGPFFAVYYASKAYVLSFSEALRNELAAFGITVTALCPGPTKTDFFKKQPDMLETNLLRNANTMSAREVAFAGFSGLMRGKAIVIPGFINKFLAFGVRLLPRNFVTAISRWTLQRIH